MLFDLRPYQNDAIAALWDYWRRNGGNPLIDHATGCGKSYLIAAIIRRLYAERPSRRFLVLSHVRELIEQDIKALLALWPEAEDLIGIDCASLGCRNTTAVIVFGTVQSVRRDIAALGVRNLCIVDEAHLIPAAGSGQYRRTIKGFRNAYAPMRVAGLTATPFRLDTGRLDQGENRIFDHVVHRYGIREATADGWLAPLVSKLPETGEIGTSAVARRAGEYASGELERAADTADLVGAAVREIIKHAGDRRSWLCFACGVDHAHHIAEALRGQGITAATVTGDTPGGERSDIFAAFKRGHLRALTGCQVFTTGFDADCVDVVAILRPTLSPGLFVQMAGRGTRKAEGKTDCLLLDFGGNIHNHGPVDGIDGSGTPPEPTKICPRCRRVLPRSIFCCDCGHGWPRPPRALAPTPRAPKHDIAPSGLPPVSTSSSWISVQDLTGLVHVKPGSPPSLQVLVVTAHATFRVYLAFEHPFGVRRARGIWRAMGGRFPAPSTTAEALARMDELTVGAIAVKREGRFWNVVAYRRETGEAVPKSEPVPPALRPCGAELCGPFLIGESNGPHGRSARCRRCSRFAWLPKSWGARADSTIRGSPATSSSS